MPEQLPETRFLDMAAKAVGMPSWNYLDTIVCDYREELRTGAIAHACTLAELAALKPVPEVDEDEMALIRILEAWHSGEFGIDPTEVGFAEALAAFKSERPRYTPEQATEIAREICARVALVLGWEGAAHDYRSNLSDFAPEMTFAKAMLLHETGEGK